MAPPVVPVRYVESPDVKEWRDIAVNWQRQFHELKTLAEGAGFVVGYGDRGEVTLASGPSPRPGKDSAPQG